MNKIKSLTSIFLTILIVFSTFTLAFSFSDSDSYVNGDTETAGEGCYYFLDDEGRIYEGIPGDSDHRYISDFSFDKIAFYNKYIYAVSGKGIYKVRISDGAYESVYFSEKSIKRFSMFNNCIYFLDCNRINRINLNSGKTESVVSNGNITSMWFDAPFVLSYMTDGSLIYSVNLKTGEKSENVNFYSAFVGDIPVISHSSDGTDGLSFSSLQAKFPAGKYWNHMGTSVNNPNGYTGTPCNHSANGTNYCNHPTFYSAWQCHGYAIQCGYDMCGSNPMNWTKYTSSSSVSDIRAGDVIRLDYGSNDHTMVVLAVNGDTVYFTDCNSYGTCNIRWGTTKTKSTLTSQFKYLLKCPDYLSNYYSGGSVNVEYTIKFDLNDSSGEGKAVCSETSRVVKDGNSYGDLPVPSREGYDFDGWFTDPTAGSQVTSSTKAGSNATVYAHWKVKIYLISYNANAGGESISNLPSNQTKKHYETVNLDITSRVLYRPNYNFNYWNTSPDGSGASYDKQNYKFSGNYDMVLYAQWEGLPKSVYFEPQGGIVSASYIDVKYGSPYGELPVPVRDGYKFKYWKTSTGTVISSSTIMTETSGIRLYAEWEDGSYSISYNSNSNGETVYGMPSDQSKTSSQSIALNLPSPTRYGYIFCGWNSEPDGSGESFTEPYTYSENKSIIIYAQWKPIESKITFDSNGGSSVGSSVTVAYGNTYGSLPTPTMTGKDFLGWFMSENDDGSEPVNSSSVVRIIEDTTLYAHWDTSKYAVRYFSNNSGVSNMPANSSREYGQSDFKLDGKVPVREGFTFIKWNTSSDGKGADYYPNQKYSGNASLSLYAVWERNTYVISFDSNGGEGSPDSQIKEYDISLRLSEKFPVRNGYTFTGWNSQADGKGNSYSSGDNYLLNSAVTLYAQWSPNTYIVSFDAAGGKASFTRKEYLYDSTYSLPDASRKGYIFEGWFTSADGGYEVRDGDTVKIENDTTFFARWKAKTFTVSFDADGGNCSDSQIKVSYGSLYGRLPVPVKKGYTFAGWFTDKTFERQITSDSTVKIVSDTVLVAAYTAGVYTVVFDADGGETDTVSKTVRFGKKYETLPVPVKNGFIFDGWYNSEGIEVTASDIVTDDFNHTLYAIWKAPEFTVSFYNGNDVYKTKSVTYGMTYGELPEITVAGKEFCGWYDLNGRHITDNTVFDALNDISLNAALVNLPSASTVRFVAGGKVISDVKYSGNSVAEPSVPEIAGFTGKWSDYTLDGGPVVVSAEYEPVTYTATFSYNETSLNVNYKYGERISVPSLNIEQGYAIKSWNPEIPVTMPAKNISFSAESAEITYAADFISGGKTVFTDNYTVNSKSLSEPVVTPKKGYIGEWESYTLIPGGIKIYAVYKPVKYTAEFFADGVLTDKTQFTVEDAELSLPSVPEKVGFSGEWEEYEIIPQNIRVNAVYTANLYSVTFAVKETGETVKTVYYHYGEKSINEPSVPEKELYDGKWSDYILGASDTVSYAVYTPKVYIATFVSYGETVAQVPFTAGSTSVMSPPAPTKFGVRGAWEDYTVTNADFTVNAVFDFPSVNIKNYISERNEDYKSSVNFTAVVTKLTSTATVHWFINDKDVTPDGTLNYTVTRATASYTVQAKLIAEGNILAESSVERVNIKTGFFSRLIAFFRQIFGRLPFIKQ